MPLWKNLLPGLYGPAGSNTPEGATTRAVGGASVSTIGSTGGQDVDRAVQMHYERVLWVFKCVDSKATKLSELDIVFKQGKGNSATDTIDYDLDRILNRKANNYETGQAFRYRVYTLGELSTRGVFCEIVRSAAGGISQLHVIPPGRCEPIPDPNTFVAGYRVSNGEGGVDYLPPERVLWIKLRPHPTDPYRQMTPLMAAGLAADTDWLARIYNRNFLANDGRPGMLITVQDLQPQDADKLQARFSGGSNKAGVVSIIEGNGIDVADMSSNPRDVMWAEALDGSRDDILAAFGVPMIAFGSSNEKTFDNADAESVSYWTETLKPTANIYGRAFDRLTSGGLDDDIHVIHDTSEIYALQQVERDRNADLQAEVANGLRTLNSYFEEMGRPTLDIPEANVLWMNPALMPVGAPADVEKIRKSMEPFMPMAPGAGFDQQQPAPRRVANTAPSALSAQPQQLRQISNTVNAQGNTLRQLAKGISQGPRNDRLVKRPRAHKALPTDSGDSDKESDHRVEIKDSRIAIESLGVGLVEAWADRLASTSGDRLQGPKARKHTRHWIDNGEAKARPSRVLDANYVVNKTRWASDLEKVLMPMLNKIVDLEIQQMIDQYGVTDGVDFSPVLEALRRRVVREALAQTDVLTRIVTEAEHNGDDLATIKRKLSKGGRARGWVQPFVAEIVTTAKEGARAQVAQKIGRIKKTWVTSGDERVRDSHRRLSGKTVNVDAAFNVGGIKIRYPGDPLAPIGETINCRCSLTYSL